jgi:hypothetical protein
MQEMVKARPIESNRVTMAEEQQHQQQQEPQTPTVVHMAPQAFFGPQPTKMECEGVGPSSSPKASREEADAHCHAWFGSAGSMDARIKKMMEREQEFSILGANGALKSHEEMTRIAIYSQWLLLTRWLDASLGVRALEWKSEVPLYDENRARLAKEAHVFLDRTPHKHGNTTCYTFVFMAYKADQ